MTSNNPATIKTKRLTLRPLINSDWKKIHDYVSNPDVVKHLPWGPNRENDTKAFLNNAIAAQQEKPQKRFDYAILLNGKQDLIGHCSIKTESPDFKEGSLRYFLHPTYWGNEYAAEAAEALAQHAFDEVGLHRLFAVTRPDNVASLRVLQKIGMRQEAHFRKDVKIGNDWKDSLLYAVLKQDWRTKTKTAVIFDMDGVIVDSEPLYLSFNQQVFNDLGITVTPERYDKFVGVSAESMWSDIKSEYGIDKPVHELIKQEARAIHKGLAEADFGPMPGLLTLIHELEVRNIRFAVASSSLHSVINIILSRLNIKHKFHAIVSGEDVVNGKPSPDIFLLAAKKLGVAPADCVVIEDSSHGARGAKDGGMRCVGFANPNSGNQDLSPADILIDSYSTENIETIFGLLDHRQTTKI
jgi:HAD superfamily hydrolase (TIGR01509 family)